MPRPRRINLKAQMRVVTGTPANWDLPSLKSRVELAGWFSMAEKRLNWLAAINDRVQRSSHYRYRWVRKRSGLRLIEASKPMLKRVQRQILDDILSAIPVSDSAHGFTRGRNVLTYASAHVKRAVCLKMDLKNFFPSIGAGRVYKVFERVGYPLEVARAMTGLCTTVTPGAVIGELAELPTDGQSLHAMYAQRHLPQGAPTSPALANLCAFNLDCRLSGLAGSMEGRYTRYADDLLFSFGSHFAEDQQARNRLKRMANLVAVIAIEEGFDVNFRKTRVMFASQRQSAAGVILNQRTNLCRKKYDRLKATLFNCARFGPDSQDLQQHSDFRAHLKGQICWVRQLNPAKATKLEALFERIEW